ncbi:hypothetical protein HA075_07330 [bacterium BFN5]|nr:hypothetical protein HA075_07270 [bacterium BFN5]QJW45678.1 hypothetical protein HA075_07330 [bacterium BFN5]
MNREAIYNTLFRKLEAIEGLVTASRVLKHWHDVPPSGQPALFMTQDSEVPVSRPGLPTTWNLVVSLYLYCNAGNDSDKVSAIEINKYLDAIQEAIRPDMVTGCQTLSGLVRDVKFGEKIETDKGLLGAQSVAIIPINIILEN